MAVPGSSEQDRRGSLRGSAVPRTSTHAGRRQIDTRLHRGPGTEEAGAPCGVGQRPRPREGQPVPVRATDAEPGIVAAELQSVREAIGSSEDVARFFESVLRGGQCSAAAKGKACHSSRRALKRHGRFVRPSGATSPSPDDFELPLAEGEVYLGRTSPIVEGLAGWTHRPGARSDSARCAAGRRRAAESPRRQR